VSDPPTSDQAESGIWAPLIDVVVLTRNDGDLLATAVETALASQGVQVTVWVIDNGSNPVAQVPDDPRVQLIRNDHNAGVGGGRNQGVRLGHAPIVCLLDSDAALGETSLISLVEPFQDPSIGISVPVFADQHPTESAGAAPTLLVKLQRAAGRRSTYEPTPGMGAAPIWDVDFGIGACQVFRRDCFDAVGGIDASDPFGPEDLDFCLRVHDAGWRVVQVAGAAVVHPPRRAHRSLLSRRGARHALAVGRHYVRRRRKNSMVLRSSVNSSSPENVSTHRTDG
jgi:GT2 family glycosyltransferase